MNVWTLFGGLFFNKCISDELMSCGYFDALVVRLTEARGREERLNEIARIGVGALHPRRGPSRNGMHLRVKMPVQGPAAAQTWGCG